MAGYKRVRLGDALIEKGMITQEQLGEALEKKKGTKMKIGEVLVEMKLVSEMDIVDVLCEQMDIEYVDLRKIVIDEAAVGTIDENFMKKNLVIPFAFDEKSPNILKVAMVDPMDIFVIDDIGIITNMQVKAYISTQSMIESQLDKLFGNNEAMAAAEQFRKEREAEGKTVEDIARDDDVENSPIVQLVKNILEQAVRKRASDIHIEPGEFQVRVRFRIDGSLVQIMNYDISLSQAIAARVKIISGMDISEKRKPQDGRIAMTVDRKDYDVRVSALPTVHGEKIVMRVTGKEALSRDKANLGFNDEELDKFDMLLKNPHGIILVTGPTGSGKSTTLYTALSELNTEDVNIITVEDPVEADLEGINQVQVNNKADMTFAAALRSILRQDPDIIMIGEIRDGETAEIAVKAAITGHLVVSTLHTNSTASSITRLIDMGIEPYMIGDSVVGVIAQRLVKRLCPECKKPREATEDEKRMLGVDPTQSQIIYEPSGCKACGDVGYFGRIGVYEILPVTSGIRTQIVQDAVADKIKDIAVKEGMHTLRDGAASLVLKGVTGYKDMMKIAYEAG